MADAFNVHFDDIIHKVKDDYAHSYITKYNYTNVTQSGGGGGGNQNAADVTRDPSLTYIVGDSQFAQFESFLGESNLKFTLCYKASRDGFNPTAFHSRCDNKGRSVTWAETTNNWLVGGYTSVSWVN